MFEIKIVPNDKGTPPAKLADAELHFTDGPLAGLRLIGFGVFERKYGAPRNVTFPARQYSVNGRDLILDAYAKHERRQIEEWNQTEEQPAAAHA